MALYFTSVTLFLVIANLIMALYLIVCLYLVTRALFLVIANIYLTFVTLSVANVTLFLGTVNSIMTL